MITVPLDYEIILKYFHKHIYGLNIWAEKNQDDPGKNEGYKKNLSLLPSNVGPSFETQIL